MLRAFGGVNALDTAAAMPAAMGMIMVGLMRFDGKNYGGSNFVRRW
jgi:hypothetical protein